jgi:uncharacterized protein
MISDSTFYLVAIPAVLLTGISKGGFGGAMGGIAVPLMALATSAPRAASIMLPLLCLSDLFGFRIFFGKWDRKNLEVLLGGAVIGITAGALTFHLLSEPAIRVLIGLIAVTFTLQRWLGSGAEAAPAGRSLARGTFWGSLSGFTSFLAHAGGPPVMIYLLPQRLDKTTYVATSSVFFMVVNAVKLVPYTLLGQFSRANLLTSAVLAPLVPLGVWLGLWLHHRVNQVLFYRLMEVFLLATGAQLIWQGVAAL